MSPNDQIAAAVREHWPTIKWNLTCAVDDMGSAPARAALVALTPLIEQPGAASSKTEGSA